MKIRYPSIFDMEAELWKLKNIIKKIPGVTIVEITHSLVVISDQDEEYEYDSIHEAIEEWSDVLTRMNSK